MWDVVSMQWHQSLWRWRLVYHSPIRRLLSVALAATRGSVEDIIKWENGRNITNMIDAAAPLLTTIMKGLGSLKNCWDSDLMVNIIYIFWFIRRPGPEMNVDADPKTCQGWNMKWAKLGWWSRGGCGQQTCKRRFTRRFAITEMVPTMAFSWLKAATIQVG